MRSELEERLLDLSDIYYDLCEEFCESGNENAKKILTKKVLALDKSVGNTMLLTDEALDEYLQAYSRILSESKL